MLNGFYRSKCEWFHMIKLRFRDASKEYGDEEEEEKEDGKLRGADENWRVPISKRAWQLTYFDIRASHICTRAYCIEAAMTAVVVVVISSGSGSGGGSSSISSSNNNK
ncbi:hypothetical protein PV326_002777 [Microctonus aethiopoides]|nr:hypothetical protein PV326_002777 [Microctonus aethiopoides]